MDDICDECVRQKVCIDYINFCRLRNSLWTFSWHQGIELRGSKTPRIAKCPNYFPEPEEGGDG